MAGAILVVSPFLYYFKNSRIPEFFSESESIKILSTIPNQNTILPEKKVRPGKVTSIFSFLSFLFISD